eukprot:GFYU01006099.1.p1 GENE.GFYU01006099.1~~GFYU01006099.1.p1  ORF type:complete len:447 (-),score=120.06 GFYU01006099.1:212-1552(-)
MDPEQSLMPPEPEGMPVTPDPEGHDMIPGTPDPDLEPASGTTPVFGTPAAMPQQAMGMMMGTENMAPYTETGGEVSFGGDGELYDPKTSVKERICVETLMYGYVNSFIEFFYLTHQPEDADVDDDEDEGGAQKLDLVFLQRKLIEAEKGKRQGLPKVVFNAYKDLADRAQNVEEYGIAIGFFNKCLDIAKLTGDPAFEMQANHDLGIVVERTSDIEAAIRYHERHLELATNVGEQEGVSTAHDHLVVVYRAHATELSEARDFANALTYYEKCLESARACGEKVAEGYAYYHMGLCYNELGDAEQSIEYNKKYLEVCRSTQDMVGEGQACAALARAYQSQEDPATAIEYLESYLKLSKATGSVQAQGDACGDLGILYNSNRDYNNAVEFFEKEFDLKRTLGEKKLVDQARVNVGIAKGNARLEQFMSLVKGDLDALIDWKNTRSNIV